MVGRVCSVCKTYKEEGDFYPNRRRGRVQPNSNCKSCEKERRVLSYALLTREEKDAHNEKARQRYAQSSAKKDYNKNWAQENKSKVASYSRKYLQLKPEKILARNAYYRTLKKNQTPSMSPEEISQIEYLYWLARDLKTISGETYHVDHIIPITKGGLHTIGNLQILPRDMNIRKSDKVW